MNTAYAIPLSAPHLSGDEFSQLYLTTTSNWLSALHQETAVFEQKLCTATGTNYISLCSTGSAALELALATLGISAGDEVLCQSLTFVATANAITRQNAIPVFIDSEPETWNICPDTLEAALRDRIKKRKRPKAVVVVDVYGMPAKWKQLEAICEHYGVQLIEDAAEALGSRIGERACGSFGRLAVLSFNRNKIITTLGGGALLSNDQALIERAQFLNTQAREKAPYYLHQEQGFNYQWSPMNSHVGRVQLQLLADRVTRRRANFAFYKQALGGLSGITFQAECDPYFSNRWLTALTIDTAESGTSAEAIGRALAAHRIEARPVFNPMHCQPLHKKSPFYGTGLTDKLFQEGLCLPSGSNLTLDQLQQVVEVIKRVFDGH